MNACNMLYTCKSNAKKRNFLEWRTGAYNIERISLSLVQKEFFIMESLKMLDKNGLLREKKEEKEYN